jgi:hypothetical protein
MLEKPRVSRALILRLALDLSAAALLALALAYDWLGGLSHEVIGTAMFLLIIAHNIFNRRWYGAVPRMRRDGGSTTNMIVTLLLVTTMIALLTTSVMISRSVFSVLAPGGGFNTRQVHALAGYWALIVVGIHVGLRWSMIMGIMAKLAGFSTKSPMRTAVLRGAAATIAVHGAYSWIAIDLGSKLTASVTMGFLDFEFAALPFFIHLASIAGLCVLVAHYTSKITRRRNHLVHSATK